VLSISDAVAARLLGGSASDLEALQAAADARLGGDASRLPESAGHAAQTAPTRSSAPVKLAGHFDLETLRAEGHDVIGRLQVGSEPSTETIVLGAHFDHLGHGEGQGSLATGDEIGRIHPGADDNASGVAVLLEIAQRLVHDRSLGVALGRRDFVFAAWSGEELGLLGSDAWVQAQLDPHSRAAKPVAYLNFDMVGRLRKQLIVQGLGSSKGWAELLDRAAADSSLSILSQQDSYLPTDATSFYTRSIPILSAFTGVHSEYHTPRDTPDLLNYEGAAEIAQLFSRIAIELSQAPDPLVYEATPEATKGLGRSGFRVYLGTVPDYAQTDLVGVRLSGVAPDGPAAQAGVRGGDVIVEVDGRPIENLYDYTYALEALRIGAPARIVVLRDGERVPLEVVPASRD
jgi:Zn-dependent M28 family amino/carboxypeptidase